MKNLSNLDLATTFIITLIGIYQGQVTAFYVVYLFWFQELIRTIIDFIFIIRSKDETLDKSVFFRNFFSSLFLMFIYLVFIVGLFGVMLNWGNIPAMRINVLTVIFRNMYFNLNILLFIGQYVYFKKIDNKTSSPIDVFNRRHILLHISIILGGFLQLSIVPRLKLDDTAWSSVLVIIPFMILKFVLERRFNREDKK